MWSGRGEKVDYELPGNKNLPNQNQSLTVFHTVVATSTSCVQSFRFMSSVHYAAQIILLYFTATNSSCICMHVTICYICVCAAVKPIRAHKFSTNMLRNAVQKTMER